MSHTYLKLNYVYERKYAIFIFESYFIQYFAALPIFLQYHNFIVFTAEQISIEHICYIVFTCSSTDRHLGWFQILAIVW